VPGLFVDAEVESGEMCIQFGSMQQDLGTANQIQNVAYRVLLNVHNMECVYKIMT
jgi:hypothetical protein